MEKLPLSVKYNLNSQDSYLDAYDAGIALSGISRSLAISMHYFVNGSVIKQAPALDGAKINLKPPKEGSFVFEIDIELATAAIGGMAASGVVGNACYDFLKYIYSRTVGRDYNPTNKASERLIRKDEGAIDAIVDTIESDVASIHRPIIHNAQNVFILNGQNNIVRLDSGSYDYVRAKIVSDTTDRFIGNVSSFNAYTGRGRIYLKSDGRNISFSPEDDEFTDEQKALLAWSLNEYVNGNTGLLQLEATYVSTPGGLLKALNVREVNKLR